MNYNRSFTILVLCLSVTLAFQIQCTYTSDHSYYVLGKIYRCELQNNLNINLQYLTFIESSSGSHSSSKSNNDVLGFQADNKHIEYFPSGLDYIFVNLQLISISYGRIKEVHRTDLRPFPKLITIYLDNNDIEVIEDNLFGFNPDLQAVSFVSNKLVHVGQRAFDNLNQLRYLWLNKNPCIDGEAFNDTALVRKLVQNVKSQCVNVKYSKIQTGFSIESLNRIDVIISNFKTFQVQSCLTERPVNFEESLSNVKESIIQQLNILRNDLVSSYAA